MNAKYKNLILTGVGVAIGGILFSRYAQNTVNNLLSKVG